MLTEFEGRVAVVTGAGSGIGRALAVGFAAEGMRVVCSDIDAENGTVFLRADNRRVAVARGDAHS